MELINYLREQSEKTKYELKTEMFKEKMLLLHHQIKTKQVFFTNNFVKFDKYKNKISRY